MKDKIEDDRPLVYVRYLEGFKEGVKWMAEGLKGVEQNVSKDQ